VPVVVTHASVLVLALAALIAIDVFGLEVFRAVYRDKVMIVEGRQPLKPLPPLGFRKQLLESRTQVIRVNLVQPLSHPAIAGYTLDMK